MVKRNLKITAIFLCLSAVTLVVFTKKSQSKTYKIGQRHKSVSNSKPKLYPKNFFTWPIKGPIDLAGNFGELRTNHFHSGIDIRTNEGRIGVPIYAAGDGYIGRINISAKGYGKAIYIVHPNGYTTVYAHLSRFVPAIAKFIENEHYSKKSFEIESLLPKGIMPIKKGELIAYSGNTGGSAGPHLHFEIRDTDTEESINPLHFGLKLSDKIKPSINSITLYSLDNTNRTETGTYNYAQIERKGITLQSPILYVNSGTYAIGASWVDYLRSGGFKMGLPYAKLFVNNQLVFEQKIDRFPFSDWRLMNCHLDHPLLEEQNLKIIKLFVDDGNTLKIYPNTINRGRIKIDANVLYHVKILVSDFAGHNDSIKFTLSGEMNGNDKQTFVSIIPKNNPNQVSKIFYPQQSNVIEFQSDQTTIHVEVPKGVLYDTILFKLGPSQKTIHGQTVWDIMSSNIPINDSFSIAFKPQTPIDNPEKYVVIRLTRAGAIRPEGGIWRDGMLYAKAKMLGQFYVDVDETPPALSDVKIKDRNFSAKITDELSGIHEAILTLDEKWILVDYEPKADYISGKIPDFIPIGSHVFSLMVTDKCGNLTRFQKNITL